MKYQFSVAIASTTPLYLYSLLREVAWYPSFWSHNILSFGETQKESLRGFCM